MVFDTSKIDVGDVEGVDHYWTELYPDSEEELPDEMPDPSMKQVKITPYFDVDHVPDLVTRRSVTGELVYVNSTPIKWYYNINNNMEASTYVSDLFAIRLTT